jgi:S1-C subfamily serine protease
MKAFASVPGSLASFSSQLAQIVEEVGASVVAVHGRHRVPSSGTVWQAGVIVTAAHTLRRDESITVVNPAGGTQSAVLAGRDSATDLAVLKTEAAPAPVRVGDAAGVKPGHFVVAVARGEADTLSASAGIVASVAPAWQSWRGGRIDRLIRLDGGLYPGFSGAPLVEATGEVVGICTSGLTRGRAVAIPESTVSRVVEALLASGRVARAYLGLGMQPVSVSDALAQRLGLDSPNGVLVVSVQAGGPAEKAGALVGDVLLELGAVRVADVETVQAVLAAKAVDERLPAVLVRGGERIGIEIQLGERPHGCR